MRGTKHTAAKYLAYAFLLLLAFALQNARGPLPALWGAKPDALPFIIAAIALFEGPYAAGGLGFAAGILASVHSPIIEGLSALYLMLFGVAFGMFGSYYIRRVAPAAMLGGMCCMIFQGVARYVFYFSLVFGAPLEYGAKMLAGELILSAVPGLTVFYLVRAVHRRFTQAEAL